VATCSALKRQYRDALRAAGDVTFVFLDVSPGIAGERVAERRGHFMKAEMVAGQFATLERPGPDEHDVITVDAERPVDGVVDDVVGATLTRPAES